jgi:hypothetical protein
VVGAPATGHPACKAGGADVCAAAACDGVVRDACMGFTAPTTACRVASCAGGVATLAGNCTGKGQCADPILVKCAPFACAGDKCATTCTNDADCDKAFRCDTTNGQCVSRDAASCDGMHTLKSPDGTEKDCTPYLCEGSACKTTCSAVTDCVFPYQCNAANACFELATATSTGGTASGGCSCDVAGKARTTRENARGLGGAVLFALLAVRRGNKNGKKGRNDGRKEAKD